jgi:hypothetical protein
MTPSFVARIQRSRTQRNDGRGVKVNILYEGIGDTFGLAGGERLILAVTIYVSIGKMKIPSRRRDRSYALS